MKTDEVPQDGEKSTYGGGRKLLYAVDQQGDLVGVQSAGWDVESEATQSALQLIKQQCDDAWRRASAGETSPLEYYMYYRRMDLLLLAQTSGFFRWRIRRHFNPRRYRQLSPRILSRYAEALELSVDTLQSLPEHPPHESGVS